MAVSVMSEGVAGATQALKHMLTDPWSYFPQLVGGDLVGLGQFGNNKFVVAFGRTWRSGTPTQTDPPLFNSPVVGGPRVFTVDTAARLATEITPSSLLTPNASLRAAVMAGAGMHLVVSDSTGTHAQFIQNFAHQSIRALNPYHLSPALRVNGSDRAVEWDRGAATYSHGLFAIGADVDHQLYVAQIRTRISGMSGYDASGRTYMSDKGWTRKAKEQTPLRRADGTPLTSSVPVAIAHRRQHWFMIVPHQTGNVWGWEVLRASSLLARFSHVTYLPGQAAVPTCARLFPSLVLETDPNQPPGMAWSYSQETPTKFVPSLSQLVI